MEGVGVFARYVLEEPYEYIERMHFRDRKNLFEYYSEAEFLTRFRFTKFTVRDVLLPLVRREHLSNRGMPIPDHLKLLIALRFYATGSFQLVCGDLAGVSEGAVSKIVKNISNDLVALIPRYVKLPISEEDVARCKRLFYEKAQFPGVVGCIDCTHIAIVSPGGELYRNRKGWFSLNVQVVAGPSMEITDIVCRWQGSAHDARIFHNSRLKHRFEANEVNGILLGDSGYPLLPYLFTPILHPVSASERRYNISHIRTRCVVERAFGVWKRRFPCLGMKLRVTLFTSQKVILACAVLHNLAIQQNDPPPDPWPVIPPADVPVPGIRPRDQRPNAIRASFIQRHFGGESVKRRAPISRGAAIEKEMEVRLQNLASCKENEEALQLLRLKEAQLAIAVKEQELANAKAAGDIQQQEADFRRRILEAQLHVEEAKLQRVLQGGPV